MVKQMTGKDHGRGICPFLQWLDTNPTGRTWTPQKGKTWLNCETCFTFTKQSESTATGVNSHTVTCAGCVCVCGGDTFLTRKVRWFSISKSTQVSCAYHLSWWKAHCVLLALFWRTNIHHICALLQADSLKPFQSVSRSPITTVILSSEPVLHRESHVTLNFPNKNSRWTVSKMNLRELLTGACLEISAAYLSTQLMEEFFRPCKTNSNYVMPLI